MISYVASIGGETCCTSKTYSAKMSCAWIGRGRWHVKCNFSSCLQYYCSVMPSKCPAHAYARDIRQHAHYYKELALFRYPNAVKAVFCSLFGIFVAFLLAIAIFTKFTPAYDVMHSLGTDIYIAPWTRVLPYIIGVAAGYAMFTFNGVMPLGEVSISIRLISTLCLNSFQWFNFFLPSIRKPSKLFGQWWQRLQFVRTCQQSIEKFHICGQHHWSHSSVSFIQHQFHGWFWRVTQGTVEYLQNCWISRCLCT